MVFCYWEIRSQYDAWLAVFLSSLSFLFTGVTLLNIFKFHQARRAVSLQKQVRAIFCLLPLWGIAHFAKLTFGLIVYQIVFSSNDNPPLEDYSKIFCVLDSISTTILHAALLTLPYIWIYSIIGSILKSSQQQDFKISKYLKIARVLKAYIFIRIFIFTVLFLCIVVTEDFPFVQKTCEIKNTIVVFESFVCMVLFGFMLQFLAYNSKLLNLQEKEKKKLIKQFASIWVACFLRLSLNLTFIVFQIDKCKIQQSWVHSIVYLLFGITFTHYLPIFLILKLYYLPTKDLEQALSHKKAKNVYNIVDNMQSLLKQQARVQ